MLEITVERNEGYVLCRPSGELDAYTVAQFREALTELADERFVLVDLSHVPFMDSAGLGALIGGIRRARENDGDVAVACVEKLELKKFIMVRYVIHQMEIQLLVLLGV